MRDVVIGALNDSDLVSIQCETENFLGRIFNVGPEILTISVLEAGIAHIRIEAVAAVTILNIQEMGELDARITI